MFNNYLYSNRQSVKISGLWVFGATGSMAVSKTADRGSNPLSPALYLIYITCEGGNFVFLFFLKHKLFILVTFITLEYCYSNTTYL